LCKVEIETLPLIAVIQLQTDIAADKIDAVAVPPLPLVKVEIETLPLLAVIQLKTDIAVDKMDAVALPPVPFVQIEIETLPLLAVIPIKTEDIAVDKIHTVTVPPPPLIEPDIVLSFAIPVTLTIEDRHAGKMHTVAVPAFEENKTSVYEMHLSEEAYTLLEKMEGFSPELYNLGDGGFTIGFGFFVANNEVDKWRKGVTWEDAERMIRQKVPAYEDQVKRYINVPLTQEQFDALTMLAYNLGGFSKASSIVNDINGYADYDKLQYDWMRFVHSKAPGVMKGLMNRRNDELQVKNESNYQLERKVLIFKTRK
jgi:GH24 family phage-related lysozyme (muramidase)